MVENNQNEPPRTAALEISIVSLSIFVAVCMGLMAVLMTRPSFQVGINAASIASGTLLVAILLFIFANDFFILMIYYTQHKHFGLFGSILYGLGEVLMIVGISIAMNALATSMLAYIFLGVFTLGFITYNVIRFYTLRFESPAGRLRLVLRALSLASHSQFLRNLESIIQGEVRHA